MQTTLSAALLAALPLVLAAAPAAAFSASFRWCAGSPAFTLKGVPEGTAKLDFRMTDLDKPDFRHGGGAVAYHGQASIPCGAFSAGFVGPSPPPGQVHTYRFVIRALEAQGSALATTTASRKYP